MSKIKEAAMKFLLMGKFILTDFIKKDNEKYTRFFFLNTGIIKAGNMSATGYTYRNKQNKTISLLRAPVKSKIEHDPAICSILLLK